MTEIQSHDGRKRSGPSRISSALPASAPTDKPLKPRVRRLWLALAGAALLTLLGGLGLLRRHAALSSARAVVSAPPEDPTEARLRSAAEARPNDAAARLELGRYYEEHARPFEAISEYAEAKHLKPADAELSLH